MAGINDVLLACTIGDIGWLKRGLARGVNPNSRTKEGMKCLHLAAKHGMFDCVKYLLENNISKVNDQVTSTGDTALHIVLGSQLGKKTFQLVCFLIDNGGDFSMSNKIRQVPLHLAAKFGHMKSLKCLLDLGADIHQKDDDGHTPYDLACLHGKHKCARLLKALHWAHQKDTEYDTKLKQEHTRKLQEKEYLTLHTRLRMEAAECAFEEWLNEKSVRSLSPPSSCERRKKIRSRASEKTTTCATCTKSTSKSQSALSRTKSPKVHSQIKVNSHQMPRNVDSVGKPKKLYPYTNYPPLHLRSSTNTRSGKSKQAVSKSGRSSVATIHSKPMTIKFKQSQQEETKQLSSPEIYSENTASETHFAPESPFTVIVSSDGVGDPLISTESTHEEYIDEDEDLLFHDVGQTNNLESLALPSTITKDKTQGELIQLLQSLGEESPSSRSFGRSRSVILRRNSAHSIKHGRRLSLSAIPEGRMVTSYSDEDQSTAPSQILDDSFIEELIKSLSSQEPEGNSPSHKRRIVWDEDQTNSPVENDSVPFVEISSAEEQQEQQSSRRSSLTLSLSGVEQQKSSSPNEQTLKVVNMEWDTASGSVQSVITSSPLTPPPDHPHQRRSTSPRTSPAIRTVSPQIMQL